MPNETVTKPEYYQFEIGGVAFDVFDLVRAIEAKRPVSFEESSALKYVLRIKVPTPEKRVEDLEKAIECLRREAEFLRKDAGKESVVVLEAGGVFLEIPKRAENDNNSDCWIFEDVLYFIEQVPHSGNHRYILKYVASGDLATYLKDYNLEYAPKFEFTKKQDNALTFSNVKDAKHLLTTYLCHIAGKRVKLL